MSVKVALNFESQPRLRLRQRFIQHDQRFVDQIWFRAGKHSFEGRVGRIKNILREMHPKFVTDLDRALDERHNKNLRAWTLDFEFLFCRNIGLRRTPAPPRPVAAVSSISSAVRAWKGAVTG